MVQFKLKIIVIIHWKPFTRHPFGLLRKFLSFPLKSFTCFKGYFLFIRISNCTHKYKVFPQKGIIQIFKTCFIFWKVYIEKYKTEAWDTENKSQKQHNCMTPGTIWYSKTLTLWRKWRGALGKGGQKGPPKHLRLSWRVGRAGSEVEAVFWKEGKVNLGAVRKRVLGASERERRAGNRQ